MENKQFEEAILIDKGKMKRITKTILELLVDNKCNIAECEALAGNILAQCWKNGPGTLEDMQKTIDRISTILKCFTITSKMKKWNL